MKIENKNLPNSLDKIKKSPREIVDKAKSESSSSSASSSAPKTAFSDELLKSPDLKDLEEMKLTLKGYPDERKEKVAFLKAKYEKGEYSANDEDIADKIIKEML